MLHHWILRYIWTTHLAPALIDRALNLALGCSHILRQISRERVWFLLLNFLLDHQILIHYQFFRLASLRWAIRIKLGVNWLPLMAPKQPVSHTLYCLLTYTWHVGHKCMITFALQSTTLFSMIAGHRDLLKLACRLLKSVLHQHLLLLTNVLITTCILIRLIIQLSTMLKLQLVLILQIFGRWHPTVTPDAKLLIRLTIKSLCRLHSPFLSYFSYYFSFLSVVDHLIRLILI